LSASGTLRASICAAARRSFGDQVALPDLGARIVGELLGQVLGEPLPAAKVEFLTAQVNGGGGVGGDHVVARVDFSCSSFLLSSASNPDDPFDSVLHIRLIQYRHQQTVTDNGRQGETVQDDGHLQ